MGHPGGGGEWATRPLCRRHDRATRLYFNAEPLGRLIEFAPQEVEAGGLIPYVFAGSWMRSSVDDLAAVGWVRRR
jgi:hypothetical protein